MVIQNSYKDSHNLTKKYVAVMTQWSRTARGFHVNVVYQEPGRAISPGRVFISERSQSCQHMLLGEWNGGATGCGQESVRRYFSLAHQKDVLEGCGPVC